MHFCEKGALDLFSGRFGVAKQLIAYGAPRVLTFEWSRSATEDLLQPELRAKLVLMMRIGCFGSMGAAPICASFSVCSYTSSSQLQVSTRKSRTQAVNEAEGQRWQQPQ